TDFAIDTRWGYQATLSEIRRDGRRDRSVVKARRGRVEEFFPAHGRDGRRRGGHARADGAFPALAGAPARRRGEPPASGRQPTISIPAKKKAISAFALSGESEPWTELASIDSPKS